ncbi:CLUMA_CG005819, isoform A [Clunio marinus]|uniref:CLUMA_CG005819, isoform A n=1 Tax=Clunio marinus TaxID=568069 RepID=A0A1J1HW05_9DIPT|nr:CLUMA_CG005819, isoform A [Clunio marinus]
MVLKWPQKYIEVMLNSSSKSTNNFKPDIEFLNFCCTPHIGDGHTHTDVAIQTSQEAICFQFSHSLFSQLKLLFFFLRIPRQYHWLTELVIHEECKNELYKRRNAAVEFLLKINEMFEPEH